MPTFHNIVRRLLPASTQLAWSRARIERAYRREIAQARVERDRDKIEGLEAGLRFELDMQSEEEDRYLTRQLLRSARRLRVPIPPMHDPSGAQSELWYQGDQTGGWYLTLDGVGKLRAEIRSEQKARHEHRAHIVIWISALTGIVGAITGLAAVIHR